MPNNRPTDAIRHTNQAAGKLGETCRKLHDALDGLHGRKPDAARKIEALTRSLDKQQEEIGEIVRLLKDDSVQ